MTSTTTPTNDTPTPAGPDRVVVEFTRGTARFIRLFGVLALIAGIGMVLAGGVVWGMVSSELAAEKIDVAVPANLKCGNCSEDAVERLHELGGKSPQG